VERAVIEPIMLVKLIHVISSAVLFGGTLGCAVFFTLGHKRGGAVETAAASFCRTLGLFTLAALIVQPITGMILIKMQEDNAMSPWLVSAYTLYAIVLLAWIGSTLLLSRFASVGHAGETSEFALWSVLSWGSVVLLCTIYFLMLVQPALWSHAG
jgi:uncharacterized membrane protein